MNKQIVSLVLLLLSSTVLPAPTYYSTLSNFLSGTGATLTDDFSNAGYGYSNSTPNVLTDAEMSAVLGQTAFQAITLPNKNTVGLLSFDRSSYCVGCNGDFKLDFTSTAYTEDGGVYGVGLDFLLVKSSEDEAQKDVRIQITYGNGDREQTTVSPIGYDYQTGTYSETSQFWGVTDTRQIESIKIGDIQHVIIIDNLIIADSSGAFSPVFPKSANEIDSPITVGTFASDGATTETISVILPVTSGDTDYDAVAVLQYKKSVDSKWTQALDLYRYTNTTTYTGKADPGPFSGMIFDLDPGQAYDVRVTVSDPDGVVGSSVQNLTSLSTRSIPAEVVETESNTVSVGTAQELTTALSNASAGQVIKLAAGTYSGDFTVHDKAGTALNPITIRGTGSLQSIIDGDFVIDNSDYIHVENIHFKDATSGRGIDIKDWNPTEVGTTGNVIRDCYITGVDDGIRAVSNGDTGAGQNDLYIVNNVLEGNNIFGDVSQDTWGDEGILVVGVNIDVAHNTLSGFGDSLGLTDNEVARSIDFHKNYVVYGGDDGIELDFTRRNVVARSNLITNTANGLSAQAVYDGPAFFFDNLIYNLVPDRGPFKIKPETFCNTGVFMLANTAINSGRGWNNSTGCGDDVFIYNNHFTGNTADVNVIKLDTSDWDGTLWWDNNAYSYDGYFQWHDVWYTTFALKQVAAVRGVNDELITANPIFQSITYPPEDQTNLGTQVDPSGKDYRPGTNSEAIDAGKVLPNVTDGYSGIAPDIGAYESTDVAFKNYGADFSPSTHVLDSLSTGEWYEAPSTTLSTLDPCPTNNCSYSGNTFFKSIMQSWGGATFDTLRNRLFVWGGGHANYGGNDVYAFDVDDMEWVVLTEPSDPPADNAEEASDGNPVSRHTYGGIQYAPNVDKVVAHAGSRFSDGGRTYATWFFDQDTNTWDRNPSDGTLDAFHSVVMAYDPNDGTVIQLGADVGRFNPTTGVWTDYGDPNHSGNTYLQYGCYDHTREEMILIGDSINRVQEKIDMTTYSASTITPSGDTGVFEYDYPGCVYVASTDKYYAWAGGQSVYEITPSTWATSILSVAPGSDTPGAAQNNGTYGRFAYVPQYNVFIAVNAVDQNVFFFKLGQ